MIIKTAELERIRAKLDAFPPYDWEQDVTELLESIEHADRAYDALRRTLAEAEARADGNFRLYELTEKYHNEDMLLMQEMEKVVTAAYRLISGPDSEGYTKLSSALDTYERVKKERDRTY